MAIQEQTPYPPWEGNYQEPYFVALGFRALAAFLFLFACGVSIFAAGFFLVLLGGMLAADSGAELLDFLVVAAIAVLLLFICVALFKLFAYVRRKAQVAANQVARTYRDIYFVPLGFPVWMSGAGSFRYLEGQAILNGKLHRESLISLYALLACFLSSLLLNTSGMGPYVSTALGVAIVVCVTFAALRIERRSGSMNEHASLEFTPKDIKSVQCTGPLVTIRFAAPLAGKLRRVRFYVSPHFRERFFTQFDRTFPGALPEPYRTAVAAIGEQRGSFWFLPEA